jgi:putative pyruvate formate lyase activating enzyme
MMLELQAVGCHNLNWVTPSHVVPQALEALALAAEQGLRLPIVYNSSGYDSLETLRGLDGVVDLYMPDFKFWEPAVSARLAQARDYPEVARAAIREMHRQVGDLMLDESGLARRGGGCSSGTWSCPTDWPGRARWPSGWCGRFRRALTLT